MIFVDHSGRRRRILALVGVCLGVMLAAVLALLTVAALADHPVRQAPWPEPADGKS